MYVRFIDTGRGGDVHVCAGILIQEGAGCTYMYGYIDTGRGGEVHVCTGVLIQEGAGMYMYVRVY